MEKFRHYWEFLRTSFWFLPALMTAAAAGLAILAVRLDENLEGERSAIHDWIYTGSPEGARQLLATVAGSMVTVAGVVFSVTVVALSLASSQFGPRLLRNFMSDRGNQIVLGTFISTFVYCLLVLRNVRGREGGEFVPQLSITLAVLLALSSLAVLIYFIHHAAVSMQAPRIIANVSSELHATIDALFPEMLGVGPEEGEARGGGTLPVDLEEGWRAVSASRDGYVQLIEDAKLMRIAAEKNLLVRIVHRPGHFVVRGHPLAFVRPGAAPEEVDDGIRSTFVIGPQQTPTQDVEFAVNQLVEIAIRALSPGINDPFTALTCVDRLGAALCRLAERRIPSPARRDAEGKLRVLAFPVTFAGVASTAFRQIRQYGRGSAAVLIRLLETIALVLEGARREEDRAELLRQARLTLESADSLPSPADREDVERRYQATLEASGR